MSVLLPLPDGTFSKVDWDTWTRYGDLAWYRSTQGYVVCSTPRVNGKQKKLRLHRLVLAAPKGVDVDHINGDTLDNRRENLRLVNDSLNQANKRAGHRHSEHPYKGVSKCRRGKFEAYIKQTYLGRFNTAEDAAKAYNVAAQALFGVYARLNRIEK